MTTRRPALLGVNIDHVATLRQARGTAYPDPVELALLAESAGADGITVHLREDRRHIQDADVARLRETLRGKLNLELALTAPMLEFAVNLRPQDCCIVPERREELTTEGGLDVAGLGVRVAQGCRRLAEAGIRVALFIDPDPRQVDAAAGAGAPAIELHTGRYAEAADPTTRARELEAIARAARQGVRAGLIVNAGHGLHYGNVVPVAALAEITELNIGHSIVAQALVDGFAGAVGRMKALLAEARA